MGGEWWLDKVNDGGGGGGGAMMSADAVCGAAIAGEIAAAMQCNAAAAAMQWQRQ